VSLAVALGGWASALLALCTLAAHRTRSRWRLELVARAAHELRGPLTAARLAVHAPAGEEAGRLAAAEHELARAALALEDLAAAHSGRPGAQRRTTLCVEPWLRDLAGAWQPVARARGTALHLDLDGIGPATRVFADPHRLTQACANLVLNALEHGSGPVGLRAATVGDRLRIEVLDRGPGLRAPLAELRSGARAGRGDHGRGLAIAAQVAAGHGGRLAAAPSAQGARLVLELPLAPPAPRPGISHQA